jgi:SAM-dependent methyltransferase
MKFVVLGSPQSLEILKNQADYFGAVSLNHMIDSVSVSAYNLPANVSDILVELSPVYLHFLHDHLHVLHGRNIHLFELIADSIVINSDLVTTYKNLIADFDKIQKQTQGLLHFLDASAIIINSLQHIRENNLQQVLALEIGSWTGCSSYFLVKSINSLSSRKGILYCMDTWQGSQYPGYDISNYIDIFSNFKGYMSYYGVYDFIKPIMADSKVGFEILKEDTFDIIFIDGDHRYAGAYADIQNAVRIIKPGGLLIGHDGNGYADNLPADFLMDNLDKDCAFFNGIQYSCGVLKALRDLFGKNYTVFHGISTWHKKISAEDKKRVLANTRT